jgi:hypothetical protein
MNMKAEDANQDVLQNIECVIADLYKSDRSLSDYNVMSALEALIDSYIVEIKGYTTKTHKLSPPEQTLCEKIKEVCEWRLGRGSLELATEKSLIEAGDKTVEVIIRCIRKILKSVKYWNHEGGRQGYLNFIVNFF